jgi:hypothetical protein
MQKLSFIVVLISFSCFSQKPKTKVVSPAQKKETSYTVEIKITQTFAHCGGMAITEEKKDELRVPKPLAGKKFYLKQEGPNRTAAKILMEATSDSAGIIKFKVPPGKYFIVDDLKKDSVAYFALIKKYEKGMQYYTPIDKNCLNTWLNTPELLFEVTKSGTKRDLTINYYNQCTWSRIPCVQYTGPLPP